MRRSRLGPVVVTLAVTLVGCGDFCEPGDVQVVGPHVRGQRVAAYVRYCGATVDNSTVVRVLQPGDGVDDGAVAFRSYHGNAIRVRRISIDTVAVSYMGDVQKMDKHVGGITFIYNGNDQEFFDSVQQKWREQPSNGSVDGQYQSALIR